MVIICQQLDSKSVMSVLTSRLHYGDRQKLCEAISDGIAEKHELGRIEDSFMTSQFVGKVVLFEDYVAITTRLGGIKSSLAEIKRVLFEGEGSPNPHLGQSEEAEHAPIYTEDSPSSHLVSEAGFEPAHPRYGH